MFWHQLAAHLGMSVKRAQSEIDSAQFSHWIAYHRIEPFTVDRSEYMLAVVCSILVNVHRKKGTTPTKPADFLPKFGKPRKQSAKDIETTLRALLNGNN